MLKTVLHSRHTALGATPAPFAGWEMPLWYKAGAIREHMAAIKAAGVFDTGHMDVILVSGNRAGSAARDFLNFAFTKDIAALPVNRCGYGAFLDAEGGCVDDAIVYPLANTAGKAEERFGIVVNAGMADAVCAHLKKLPGADALTIVPADAPGANGARSGKIDIQGPASVRLVANLLGSAAESIFASFPYFSFKGDFDPERTDIRLADGTPVLLSRTGYTGEVGFELFLPLEKAGEVWDKLLADGADAGVLPCGLAARDSLRTGAVLPLSHQDIGRWPFINHPWPFALPCGDGGKFTKNFFGRDALRPESTPHTLPFVCADQRRVEPENAKVLLNGEETGKITTIVTDTAIARACGFVRVKNNLPAGTEIILKDARREIKATIATDIRPNRTARKKLSAFL